MSAELFYGSRQRVQDAPKAVVAEVDKCGTYAGYQRHYKRSEKPCKPCKQAKTVYVGQWRMRSGKTKRALIPFSVLGKLLLAVPAELEEWAEEQLGDAVVTLAIDVAIRCGVDEQASGIPDSISTSSDPIASGTDEDSGDEP